MVSLLVGRPSQADAGRPRPTRQAGTPDLPLRSLLDDLPDYFVDTPLGLMNRAHFLAEGRRDLRIAPACAGRLPDRPILEGAAFFGLRKDLVNHRGGIALKPINDRLRQLIGRLAQQLQIGCSPGRHVAIRQAQFPLCEEIPQGVVDNGPQPVAKAALVGIVFKRPNRLDDPQQHLLRQLGHILFVDFLPLEPGSDHRLIAGMKTLPGLLILRIGNLLQQRGAGPVVVGLRTRHSADFHSRGEVPQSFFRKFRRLGRTYPCEGL
jgi:hypothetical protein